LSNITASSTHCAHHGYDGSKLRLPGLSDHFTPHFYQPNAVARIVAEPSTLLDHVVGAARLAPC
jgi:N12 class adenine-specific DNA methylase